MTRSPRLADLLLGGVCCLSLCNAAPAQQNKETGGFGIGIEAPRDQSVIHSRDPVLKICVLGGDEKTRSSLKATLDGEEITKAIRWHGECAEWHPGDEESFLGEHHAWGGRRFEEEGWLPELREGSHLFEASITDPSGTALSARSQFRVETERVAISLGAGFPKLSLDEFDGRFAPVSLLEGRFGHQRVWTLTRSPGLVRYKSSFFSLGAVSTQLAEDAEPGETETTLWRGALGDRKGYGYRTSPNGFVAPYHGTSALLAHVDVADPPTDRSDAQALERFENNVSVATAFEGGVAFGIGRSITLDAGYEQMIVYPNWVVFPAVGGGIVHGVALGVADVISRHVARDAPRAAPIVSFLLRNAISLAIYNQRRREVNWPFGGGPGILHEGFKTSFTYTF